MCPSVSIVIPVYNMEKYLGDCLNSVLLQSFDDFQVICINDCSQERSRQIIENYEKRDPRISIINNAVNKDLAASRNIGAGVAEGKYIFFLDADDFFPDEDSLGALVSIAEKYNSDEVVGRTMRWYQDINLLEDGYHSCYQKISRFNTVLTEFPELHESCIAANKLYKRLFLQENGIIFEKDLLKFEDYPYTCKVHILAKSISYLHKHTYTHRQRTSVDTSKMYTKKVEDAFYKQESVNYVLQFISEYGNEEQKVIYWEDLSSLIKSSFSILRSGSGNTFDMLRLKSAWLQSLSVFLQGSPFLRVCRNTLEECSNSYLFK